MPGQSNGYAAGRVVWPIDALLSEQSLPSSPDRRSDENKRAADTRHDGESGCRVFVNTSVALSHCCDMARQLAGNFLSRYPATDRRPIRLLGRHFWDQGDTLIAPNE